MFGKREAEDQKLDVDFDIIEDPTDTDFPHSPNVLSRRGHKVKFTAHVREVSNGTKSLNIKAVVHVLGASAVGPYAHESRKTEVWGSIPFQAFPISGELPNNFTFKVEQTNHDEHLGQGPDYMAVVTIEESSTSLLREDADDGGEDGAEGSADTSASGEGAAAEQEQAEVEADEESVLTAAASGHSFVIHFTAM